MYDVLEVSVFVDKPRAVAFISHRHEHRAHGTVAYATVRGAVRMESSYIIGEMQPGWY